VALAAAASLLLLERIFKGVWTGIPQDVSWTVAIAGTASTAMVAFAEEFLFRGAILSGLLRSGWRFLPANAVTALFFSLSHWPGWLYGGNVSLPALALMTGHMFVYGLAFGGFVRLQGDLRTAMFVHFVNNLIAGGLFKH
jgi:membrane protease YdiL (CAAX protease family)